MPESTTATLSEPRAKGDSAAEPKPSSAAPTTTATVAGESAPEEKKGTLKDHGSRVLKSLSPEQLHEWRRTGELPDGVEIEEPGELSGNENEALLKQLTKAERQAWLEGKGLPERLTNPEAAPAKKEKESSAPASEVGDADFTKFAETTTSPLARLHSLFHTKDGQLVLVDASKEADADKLASESASGAKARLEVDHANFSAEDRKQVYEAFSKNLAPKLPDAFLNFMKSNVQPYLHSPYKFFREFTLNESFRKEVLTAMYGKDGNVDKMVKVIARFDSKFAPAAAKPKPLRLPPEPASSVGGRATAPVDEVGAAVNAGDFRRFRAAENRADYLRRTGR